MTLSTITLYEDCIPYTSTFCVYRPRISSKIVIIVVVQSAAMVLMKHLLLVFDIGRCDI